MRGWGRVARGGPRWKINGVISCWRRKVGLNPGREGGRRRRRGGILPVNLLHLLDLFCPIRLPKELVERFNRAYRDGCRGETALSVGGSLQRRSSLFFVPSRRRPVLMKQQRPFLLPSFVRESFLSPCDLPPRHTFKKADWSPVSFAFSQSPSTSSSIPTNFTFNAVIRLLFCSPSPSSWSIHWYVYCSSVRHITTFHLSILINPRVTHYALFLHPFQHLLTPARIIEFKHVASFFATELRKYWSVHFELQVEISWIKHNARRTKFNSSRSYSWLKMKRCE